MYDYDELNNKSLEELVNMRNEAYDKFVESLSNAPIDVRESFNYYINLARTIDIIIDERKKDQNLDPKLIK